MCYAWICDQRSAELRDILRGKKISYGRKRQSSSDNFGMVAYNTSNVTSGKKA